MSVGFYEIIGDLVPLDEDEAGVYNTFRSEAGIIVKTDDSPPPYAVANEFIGAELAKQIRLPLPPSFCAYVKRGANPAFCSLSATAVGATLPPIDPRLAVEEEPDLCAGVVLFDIWIANPDRHRRNIAYQRERNLPRLTIFDHSHALFFYRDFTRRYQGKLGIISEFGGRHCLLDFLNAPDYFDKWSSRIRGVKNEYLQEILEDARALGLPTTIAREGYDYLRHRRDNLDELIKSNRRLFRGISDWGFLWGT